MSSEVRLSEDPRILQIVDAIYQLAAGNLETRGAPSDRRDDLDAIILGVNILAEEFSALQQETRQQAERLAALNGIARAIAGSLQVEIVFGSIADTVQRLIPFDRASLALLEESGETMIVFALRTAMRSELGPGLRLPVTPSARAIAATRRGVLIPDLMLEVYDPTHQMLLREGFRATMAVPLITGDRIVGMLNLGAREPGAFGSEHLSLLQTVADQIAPAIENARLHEQVQRHAEELEQRVEERTAALRESHHFNETLLQTIPFGMDIVDESGHILYVSPAMKTLSPAAALGARCWDEYKDDRRQCADCPLFRGVEVGETRVLETSGALGGRTFEISHTGIIFQDRKAMLEVFHDITERKQAEQELAASEVKLRALFASMQDVVLVIDREGVFREIAPTNPDLLYRPPEELLGKSLRDVLPAEQTVSFMGIIQQVLENRQAAHIESALPIGERLIWFATAVSPMGEDRTLWVARDITERNQRERELVAIAVVSASLRATQNRAEMLPVILDQLMIVLKTRSAAFVMRDLASGETVVELARGGLGRVLRERLPLGEGLSGHVIATGQPYLNNEVRTDARLARPDLLGDIRAVACAPLIARGETIGALWIGCNSDITPGEVRLLTAIADLAANAIHRATLHEQTVRDAVELTQAYDTTIEGWSRALELRDQETEGHSRRVTEMTERLARKMGMSEAELVHIRRGALLHDIGKMGVPDSILLKSGPLTDDEWQIMRKHSEFAYEMLLPIAHLRPALDIPYCHHERWDGTGYPRGLKGDEIPLAARFFAIADTFDAITSDRPYRAGRPYAVARAEIEAGRATQFDPRAVEAFLQVPEEEWVRLRAESLGAP